MALNNNAININAGFEVGSQQPLDSRQWLSTSEMKNADVNTMPDPYFAINKEDHFLYIFSKTNSISESTGYFTKYTSDGGMTVWKGSEAERDALPEETKADESIIFYTWDTDSAEYKNVVSQTIGTVENMSEADYQALETKDARTIYTTPGHIRVGEESIVDTSEITSESRREIILIGDSYGIDYNNTSTGGSWTGWQTQFANNNPQWTVHKMATGGAGFSIAAEGRNFLQTLQYLETRETIYGDRITDIVVLGGYNDMSATTSQGSVDAITTYLNPYVEQFVAYCRTSYPNAKIHFGCIGFSYSSATNNYRCELVNQAYQRCAQLNNCKCIPNWRYILLQKSFVYILADDANSYFHPNTNGNADVAKFLAQYISTGTFTVRKGIIQNGAQVYVNNGQVMIMPNSYASTPTYFANSDLAALGTIPYNTWTKVCDLGNDVGDNLLWGASAGYPVFVIDVFLSNGTAPTGMYGTLLLKIQNKALYVNEVSNANGINLINTTCFISPVGPLVFDYQIMY